MPRKSRVVPRLGPAAQIDDGIDVRADLFVSGGVSGHIRSDNGPGFVAKTTQDWIAVVGASTVLHQPRRQ